MDRPAENTDLLKEFNQFKGLGICLPRMRKYVQRMLKRFLFAERVGPGGRDKCFGKSNSERIFGFIFGIAHLHLEIHAYDKVVTVQVVGERVQRSGLSILARPVDREILPVIDQGFNICQTPAQADHIMVLRVTGPCCINNPDCFLPISHFLDHLFPIALIHSLPSFRIQQDPVIQRQGNVIRKHAEAVDHAAWYRMLLCLVL